MTHTKHSLGQAIDQAIAALEPLEPAARQTALAAVCSHLQIELIAPSAAPSGQVPPPPTEANGGLQPRDHERPTVDIRALKTMKQPKSARDMACVVAYYLQEHAPEAERKSTVSVKELEKYFKQAGFKLPAKIEQLLVDAKRSGYFDSSATRGEYKLNAVGYNRVAHTLPESGSSPE